MANADTNFGQLLYSLESAWGETPPDVGVAGGPGMRELRNTGESLVRNKSTQQSNEIRPDRMTADFIQTGINTGGSINIEWMYGEYEPFLQALMAASAIASGTVTGLASIAASTITAATASTAAWTTSAASPFQIGAFVKVKGSGPNNGAVGKIVRASATVLELEGVTLTAETSPDSALEVTHRTLRNGVDKDGNSFLIQRGNPDVDTYTWFNGMRVASMSLNLAAEQIVTGVFDFLGKDSAIVETATSAGVASGSPLASTDNQIMAAGIDIAEFREGGAELVTGVRSVTIRIAQNLRNQAEVKTQFPIGHGFGRYDVTGTIDLYFDNRTIMDKFYQHTESSFDFRFNDADGNDIIISVPSTRYTRANNPNPGINQDVIVSAEFGGRRDPDTDNQIQFCLLPA